MVVLLSRLEPLGQYVNKIRKEKKRKREKGNLLFLGFSLAFSLLLFFTLLLDWKGN